MGLGATLVGSPLWGDRATEQGRGHWEEPISASVRVPRSEPDLPTEMEGWGARQARGTECRAPYPRGQEQRASVWLKDGPQGQRRGYETAGAKWPGSPCQAWAGQSGVRADPRSIRTLLTMVF